MSLCKCCGEEITWSKSPEGRNIARNATDGSPHRCRTQSAVAAPPPSYRGVLKALMPTQRSIVLTTTRGDLTFHLGNLWPEVVDVTPGSEIELPHAANGSLLGVKVLARQFQQPEIQTAAEIKAANETAKENLDRITGPADGECITEPLIRPPQPSAITNPEDRVCTCSTSPHTPGRMWSGETRLVIGVTVNLENYENLRVEVSGATADRDQLIQYLNETLGKFASKSEITRKQIENYKRRVLE